MDDKTPAHGTISVKPSRSAFLFPLQLPLISARPSPLLTHLLRALPARMRLPFEVAGTRAVVGDFGGPRPSSSGASAIDDESTPLPANLRVIFVLQYMENEIVSGDGVTAQCFARWETHGSAATDESGGPFSLPAPLPGEGWVVDHANGIYHGLVIDGCGATPTFPVDFHSEVGEQADILDTFDQIGEFSAVDNSTIQPNGFWTFAYTIRATGSNGGVSDFKFRGIVSVTCSIESSL